MKQHIFDVQIFIKRYQLLKPHTNNGKAVKMLLTSPLELLRLKLFQLLFITIN